MAITHAFVNPKSDGGDTTIVRPSDWNAAHAVDTLTLVGGTVTVSTPVIDAAQTWNNAAVTFTGIKLNVTSTASAAVSLLMDLQVGASSKFVCRQERVSGYLAGCSRFGIPVLIGAWGRIAGRQKG